MATITEKSRTKEIIDRLQGIIDNASPVPLSSGKVTIYKDEVQSLLSELASQMEIELKTYYEVNDRKGRIINEAKKEAEKIIYQAEHSASRMRVTKRATNVAPLNYDMLDDEDRSALGNANEIYAASLIYTDEMLTEVTELIADAYHNIRSDYEIILQVLDEKLNTISENRTELMMGLQEMETEDRSQQILEIGQLLSNELYNERMKQKMASDEYEDGSVQLTLDLQEEQEEKARQAEEKVQRTEQALAEMTAERDALMATVVQMKQEGMRATVRSVKASDPVTTFSFLNRNANSVAMQTATTDVMPQQEFISPMKQSEAANGEIPYSEVQSEGDLQQDGVEDEEEYEIVYVDEDELEEGEEYEIEYVDELEEGEEYEIEYMDETESEDEEEYLEEKTKKIERYQAEYADGEVEKEMKAERNAEPDDKEVKDAIKELEALGKDTEKAPVIPRFKKSEKTVGVSEEKTAEMPETDATEKKDSHLISRAVANREKAEMAGTVEMIGSVDIAEATEDSEDRLEGKVTLNEKDKDIKTDAQGNEYVQATMQFDEDFEIMEF